MNPSRPIPFLADLLGLALFFAVVAIALVIQ